MCDYDPIDPLFPVTHRSLTCWWSCQMLRRCTSAAASAASAPGCLVVFIEASKRLKKGPLPQTLPPKSIDPLFWSICEGSSLLQRAMLVCVCVGVCLCVWVCVCVCFFVLGLHPNISPFSLVTNNVQHLIQRRRLSPVLDYLQVDELKPFSMMLLS